MSFPEDLFLFPFDPPSPPSTSIPSSSAALNTNWSAISNLAEVHLSQAVSPPQTLTKKSKTEGSFETHKYFSKNDSSSPSTTTSSSMEFVKESIPEVIPSRQSLLTKALIGDQNIDFECSNSEDISSTPSSINSSQFHSEEPRESSGPGLRRVTTVRTDLHLLANSEEPREFSGSGLRRVKTVRTDLHLLAHSEEPRESSGSGLRRVTTVRTGLHLLG